MRLSLLLAVLPVVLAAPVINPRAGTIIPGKYIVKMKNDALQEALQGALDLLEKTPHHTYSFGSYKGFAAEMTDAIVALVSKLPGVCRFTFRKLKRH